MKHLIFILFLSACITNLFAQNPSVPGYKSTIKPKKNIKQKKADKQKKAVKKQPINKKKKTDKPKKDIKPKLSQPKPTIKPKQASQREFFVENKLTKIDLIGFQFEKSYSTKHTIAFGLYTNFLFPYIDDASIHFTYGLLPKIELSNRYYYNMEKRKNRGKPYEYNSGPYVAGKVELQTLLKGFQAGFDEYNAAAVGLLWGLQNNTELLTFNFEIGLGYGFTKLNAPSSYFNGNGVAIMGKLNFGFLLNRRT